MSRRTKSERRLVRRPLVGIEQLEDRSTPAVAFALSGTNLLSFDTASPTIVQTTAITNVTAGETLAGIDFRPQNGQLYGLGVNAGADTMSLYSISTRTGVATVVGTGGFTGAGNLPDPATTPYGVDFNPTVDRLRVTTRDSGAGVGVAGLNFRVNPSTGGLAGSDTDINPAGTSIDEVAYTNNTPNVSATTLYTLSATGDSLFIQNPANGGTQTLGQTVTLGGSPLDIASVNGFDIPAGVDVAASNTPVAAGSAFAVLNVGGTTGLYSVNLVDATVTLVGNVGNGSTAIQGIAVQNDLGGIPAVALGSAGTSLLRFNTATPGTVTTAAVTGLTAGDLLVGIDFRPQTGQLYGLGFNAASGTGSATLYLIDPQNGAATIVGAAGSIADGAGVPISLAGATSFGFDFNPTVDRIRIVTDNGLNFRINPNNGTVVGGVVDGGINGSGVTGVGGTAYTNAFGQSLTGGVTTQYTLDGTTDSLYIQNPPNNGVQTNPLPITVGGAPIDFTDVNGFDIPAGVRVATSATSAKGFGYATLVVGGNAGLYRIDLSSGEATLLGGTPFTTAGLTLADAPAGTVSFTATTATVAENGATATIDLTRTGSTNGSITVTVNVTGGTATAGSDFAAGPFTATFADGAATASITIPITDDSIFEGTETVVLTIAAADGAAAIGTPNVATLSITENDPQQSFTVNAATGYALVGATLVPFASTNPGAAGTPIAIVGVDAGETVVGIDFRPQNGQLYGLGVNATANTGTLYAISAATGMATPVAGVFGTIAFTDAGGTPIDLPDPATVGYDIDINPAVDRLRVVAGSLNFRVDPNTGNAVDGNAGAAGTNTDGAINGGTTTVGGTAYTNAFPNNGGVTTQYTIDAATDSIYIQNPPNAGTQTSALAVTLGGSPLDFTAVKGFDILANVNAPAASTAVTAGSALAVLAVGGVDGLYSIDLVTGAATAVGSIGATPATVTSVAFQSDLGATPVIALNGTGTALLRTLSNNVANPFTVAIGGVLAGETLVGIDFRPQTGQLFGLGINSTADTGTIYRIDPQTGAATAIGANLVAYVDAAGNPIDFTDPATTGYGFDFNPTVDRIRITSSLGLNARANPITGLPVDGDGAATGVQPDGSVNGGPTGVSATAYTNAFGQPLTGGVTTQYTLDGATDSLYIQNPPNAGTQTNPIAITLGGAPLDFSEVNGFNIPSNVRVTTSATPVSSGTGFAALTVGGVSSLYSINLATGAATLLGDAPTGLSGLATANTPTGIVEFTAATFSGTEAGPTIDLTLTRSGGSAGELAVTVNLASGTATATDDFLATPITVTFADGQTAATVSVPVVSDSIFEGDESFTATLAGATNGGVAGAISTATVTITDDDSQPTVTIADAAIVEGNAGTTQLVFTVTLSNASSQAITVTADTTDGTATAGSDYTALAGTVVTFNPGETSKTVSVDIAGDTTFEADETFAVDLSAPTNATLGATSSATGTITNDDTAPTLAINNVTVAEGNAGSTIFTFTVSLSEASGAPVTVAFDTKDGTATAGTDYTAIAGQTITFAPGEMSKTVDVTVSGDTVSEANETFTGVLSAPTGATILTGTGTGTITNDDAAPTLSINDVAVTEGNTGTTAVTFTINLTGTSDQAVTVTVSTADGTATAGSDYAAIAGQTVTFAPGETTKTVTVNVSGDTVFEANETFTVTLAGPTNATIAKATGTGTIVNDDAAPPQNVLLVGETDTAIGSSTAPPVVRTVDANGVQLSSTTLSSAFNGGVRTAVGDVNGDGTPDIVVGSGPGGSSVVRVLDGATGTELFSVNPFEAAFTGGVFVAAGDVNGDGQADIVISPDVGGGPRVRVFDGATFTQIADFFGIDDPAFRGGARVAVGDVNGDGIGDLVVAAGFQGGPRVSTIDGKTLATTRTRLFNDFFAFEETLRDGAYIAVGDVNGDGFADIVAAGGPSGGPRITVFDAQTLISSKGATLTQLANFFAGDPNLRTGVIVTVKDLDGDQFADLRTVVGGSDQIISYLGKDLSPSVANPPSTTLDGLPDFNGGVFVG